MNRRKFLRTSIGGMALVGITGVYAWQIEPFWLEFVRQELPIKNLPADLIGATMMQISDIHVGNQFDWHFIIDSFEQAKDKSPDIVVYTGDYISYENREQFKQLREVLTHAPKGRLASLAILGNHDYGHNWSQKEIGNKVTNLLEHAGIHVLRNEQKSVRGLQITGLDDYWSPNFNPQSIMPYIDNDQANILLCHNPDVCDIDIWQGYQGWILSGHTHGGQCKLPFLDPPVLPVKNKRYTSGVFDVGGGRHLYINRALGHLWQVRFNVRPEITLFELV